MLPAALALLGAQQRREHEASKRLKNEGDTIELLWRQQEAVALWRHCSSSPLEARSPPSYPNHFQSSVQKTYFRLCAQCPSPSFLCYHLFQRLRHRRNLARTGSVVCNRVPNKTKAILLSDM